MTGESGDGQTPPIPDPQVPEMAAGSEPDILALAARSQELNERAALEYAPLVEEILRPDSHDARRIEQTLDGLLDFCGHGPVLTLYRRLCRHYWFIDPVATTRYAQFYRDMWDSESVMDASDLHR
jgi:hypothetical protein